MTRTPMVPVMHLGPLHGWEWVFILLLALGPLLAAVGVVLVIRHREGAGHRSPATTSRL